MTDIICKCTACKYLSPLNKCTLLGIDINKRGKCMQFEHGTLKTNDAKEILKHLDSLMICVGNAYDTSHYLLESDMKFIEKQEKIIKELLSDINDKED